MNSTGASMTERQVDKLTLKNILPVDSVNNIHASNLWGENT
jgi:hypothetical protein